jgi:hypothetical protein
MDEKLAMKSARIEKYEKKGKNKMKERTYIKDAMH